MLSWTLFFFVLAATAAVLGFGGVAAGASIAKFACLIFVVLFGVSVTISTVRGLSVA